jgi:hypothetical protein
MPPTAIDKTMGIAATKRIFLLILKFESFTAAIPYVHSLIRITGVVNEVLSEARRLRWNFALYAD